MARTNQTAKRSTGGKAPRKELQTKAARMPQGRNAAVPAEPVSYVIEWLLLSQDEQYKERENFFLMKTNARREVAALTAVEFDSWFDSGIGAQIRNFLQKMPGKKLSGEWAKHLGVNLPVDARVEGPEGNLKRIVFISGSQGPTRFNSKVYRFAGEAKCYYASTVLGGDEERHWSQIELFSLEMTHIPPVASEDSQEYVRANFQIKRVNGQHVVVLGEVSPFRAMEYIDTWCRGHANGILHLEAPGARAKSSIAPSLYMYDHVVRFRNPGGWCSTFSVFNGMCCLTDFEDIRPVAEMTEIVTTRSMKDLENWVRTMNFYKDASECSQESKYKRRRDLKFHLMHVQNVKGDNARGWELNLQMLLDLTSGVYIVRIRGRDQANDHCDHSICVDASRRLIFDCYEDFAVPLDRAGVEACMGDGFVFDDLLEIRQLTMTESKRPMTEAKRRRRKQKKQKNREKKRQAEENRLQSMSVTNGILG